MPKLQVIFVAFMALFFTNAALAQTPDTVFIEKLTWQEIRDAIAAGKTTIIVPTGGPSRTVAASSPRRSATTPKYATHPSCWPSIPPWCA